MAKKRTTPRRAPRSTTPAMFGDGMPSQARTETAQKAEPNGNGAPVPVVPAVRPLASRRPGIARPGQPRPQLPLAQEYHYIVGDLKRLGILAASTFALLIILGLIIR